MMPLSLICVLITLSSFFHTALNVICPADLYQFASNCYAECPWNPPKITYLYASNKTCLQTCDIGASVDYFADDSTKKCQQTCPSYPIKTFYDKKRYKCVQMCPSNPSQFADPTTRQCNDKCASPLFADDKTRTCVITCPVNTYYQVNGTLTICVSKCYPNFYANISKFCVAASACPTTPVKYFGDDSTGMCVVSCPQAAGTYAEVSSSKCVYLCSLGTYADPTSQKCVTKCPLIPKYFGSNTTRTCSLQCIEGQFAIESDHQCYKVCPTGFGDYSTRKCVDICPSSQNTYADPETKLCIAKCSPGYFANNDTQSCVAAIDCSKDLVGNPLTLTCIFAYNCPIGYYIDLAEKLCVNICSQTQYANLDTRTCGNDCPWNSPLYLTFKQNQKRLCVENCPSNPRTFSDNSTQQCVVRCPTGSYGYTGTLQCLKQCPDGYYQDTNINLCVSNCTTNQSVILYFYALNTTCMSICPLYSYADNTTLTCVTICPNNTFILESPRKCVSQCPQLTYGDKFSGKCVNSCPSTTQQYGDPSTNLCVDVCPLNPDYFGQDINDGNRTCVPACTLTDVYLDPVTRTCVKFCNLSMGYFAEISSGRCVVKCSTGYGNPQTKMCTSKCPILPSQTYGDNITLRCVNKCPKNSYGDKTINVCVRATGCSTGTYGDDSTNVCVAKCPVLMNTFGDPQTKKCVKACQIDYFTDNTTRLCTKTCNTTAKLFKDYSTRKCVLNCPSMPDLYNDQNSWQCVSTCPLALPYRYSYQSIRKCVSMCPSSPVYYADQQTKSCVLKCANQTYKFINNTYRGCLSYCPMQIFNATVNSTLYQDNTTWSCVVVCPLGYYAFKHPLDDKIRKCVRICQIANANYYFADDVSRSCVLACPMMLYKTYGDRITFQCVKDCSRKQFRDQTTKQCVYNCPDTPIQYFADNRTFNCVKICPNGTYAQSINNTCVLQCPNNTYGYLKKCISQCPSGTTVYNDNTTWFCVVTCTQFPDYYSDPSSQKCVKNCTNGKFANNFTRSCVTALQCTNTTIGDILTHRCVKQCSKVPMYYWMKSTNLCGPNCFDGLFAFNDTNQCISACPSPYYGVNSSANNFYCIQYCPSGTKLKFVNVTSGFRICLAGCPTSYFAYYPKMECVTICPQGYWGNTNTKECLLGCSPLFAEDISKMCVSICPNGTTADSDQFRCNHQCQYGQFMENKTCVSGCSAGLYADNLTKTCKISCPSDPFTFADKFTNKCVFQCSPSYYGYFQNRTCLSSCPSGLFKQLSLRICINPCLQGQFGDPKTQNCITSCSSSNYSFADPTTQKCVSLCPSSPDLYGHNNECIDNCPLGTFAENFTRVCIDKCPNVSSIYKNQSFADDLTRRCIRKCSALSYSHSSSTHNLCLNVCPSGFFASQISQACESRCPNTTFGQNVSRKCVKTCPNGQWADTITQTCMDGCYNAKFSDNSTNFCQDKCPSKPDMYGQLSTNSCVLACQPAFYAHPILRMCLSVCEFPYYADLDNGLCVLQCPLYTLSYADKNLKRCINHCSNYSTTIQYADQTTKKCLTQCPSTPQLLFGVNQTNKCEQFCPSGTYGDNDTRVCLDKCVFENPKFNWMDTVNNLCVDLCPFGYFADNYTKKCQLTCFTGSYADNSTRRCVYSCPNDPALFSTVNSLGKSVCVYQCISGLYADQTTRRCVTVCPQTPFYYFHSSQLNTCVKQCPFPTYGELSSQFCVQTCKDGFYGNLTTKKCESCRTQCVTCSAYLQCLTCLTGFYMYQYECVTSCPTYPVLYFADQSSAICFKICPVPFYSLNSTKKCQLSCPLSYFPNDITRACTICPTGCLSCSMVGCETCYTNYTFVNSTKTCNQQCNQTHIYFFNDLCYLTCPNGSFLSLDLVHCTPCSKECAICQGAAANCTKCADKFFYQGTCVDACPSNYFVNADMSCIACTAVPLMCTLPPLTYKITPFTQNYKQKAYVVFSRPVDMTLDEFISSVQIYMNGVVVKPSQFKATVFNATTYLVVFTQMSSLNENSLSVGFKPGFVVDLYGNALTINALQAAFQDNTGVNKTTVTAGESVSNTAAIITWTLFAILLIFLLKGGYAVLISFQVLQILYLHIFLLVLPMPYMQSKFLESIYFFNFNFFPKLFSAFYFQQRYSDFSNDVSFLGNSSQLIIIWLIVAVLFFLLRLISNKKYVKNKFVRKLAKSFFKNRVRYSLVHDVFWITFLYSVFFAMYQIKVARFSSVTDVFNFLFAMVVLVIYTGFSIYMIKLGNRYKFVKFQQIPKKINFIAPQPSTFPLQVPLRYLRRLLLCMALVMPSLQAQVIIMMMTNFVFLIYYVCFMPAVSKLTNYLNYAIQISYLLIQGLFYAYNRLDTKSVDAQYGFSVALISVQIIIIVLVFVWMVSRLVLVIKETHFWTDMYAKIKQNKDPQYLKEQQRKKDLQYDFGSLENQSHIDKTEDFNFSSKNLNLNKRSNKAQTIFQQQTLMTLQKNKNKKYTKMESDSNSDYNISSIKKSEKDKQIISDKQIIPSIKPSRRDLKTPARQQRNNFLKVQKLSEQDLEEIIIKHEDNQENIFANVTNQIQPIKPINTWDMDFDENQI